MSYLRALKYPGFAAVLALATFVGALAWAEPPTDRTDREEALLQAENALKSAQFEALRPALTDLVAGDDTPALAHLLYGLGLYYEYREDDAEGTDYLSEIDEQIQRSLAIDPGLELDPLLYPPSFIARVEQIRLEHADDDDQLGEAAGQVRPDPQIFYFERRVETRSRLPLYLPGGMGQFYNGHTFRGVTFASIQGLGLAANAVGYWMIESLRTSTGHIASDHIGRARAWRTTQIAGVALLALGWISGAVEAHHSFEPERVRIRTLDGPPPELEIMPGGPNSSDLQIQLHWQMTF